MRVRVSHVTQRERHPNCEAGNEPRLTLTPVLQPSNQSIKLLFVIMPASFKCLSCGKEVPTIKGLHSHISQRQGCRDALRRVAQRQQPEDKSIDSDENDKPDDFQMDYDDTPMLFEPNTADEATRPIPSRRTQIEEIEDEEAGGIRRYVEDYGRNAGHVFGKGQSQFAKWREAQVQAGHAPWAPYNDLEEWELSQWLILNVGQNATDKFLKLPIVS